MDDQPRGAEEGTVCVTVPTIANGATAEYDCNRPIIGQYVTVVLKNNFLTICELQVMAEPIPVSGEKMSQFDIIKMIVQQISNMFDYFSVGLGKILET